MWQMRERNKSKIAPRNRASVSMTMELQALERIKI